jgi:CheY-like chemotaxis protein
MAASRDDGPPPDLPGALHEVGNALTVVVGWIDLALASLPPGSPGADALEVARSRAARAQRLARRAIGGESDLDAPRPLGPVVREVARGLESARGGVVKIEASVDPEADATKLVRGEAAGQVLLNLVLNAVQVSRAGAVVHIHARADGPTRAVISIRDEGPGVPTELRETLFGGGRTSRPGGVGIGLRHAATLAAEVGGSLSLAEDAPGRTGAVFEVRWPFQAATIEGLDDPGLIPPSWPPGSALRPDGSSSSARPLGRLDSARVLVVEDDEAVLDLLEASLEGRGARLEIARDAGGVRGCLAGPPFDAALVDLSPLGADVSASLGALRAHSPNARIVVISGSVVGPGGPGDVPHVDAWVRKPFEVGDVLRALDRPAP